MNLRIKKVEIILEDTSENGIDNVVISYDNSMWRVLGPVFPRHMELMSLISEFISREKR